MMRSFREIARDLAPRAPARWARSILGRDRFGGKNCWRGDYKTWQAAVECSSGYDAANILSKVRESLLAVKAGEAAFERDSVVFEQPEYVWPLVASLNRVAAENENRLSVLDYGGSLGSSYFQHRECFDWLQGLTWSVVEQEHFVTCGREEFEDDELKFYTSIAECLTEQSPSVAVLSSVLPYLENPYEVLGQVVESNIPYIFIDRTPFMLSDGPDRLTVQIVPPAVYPASYPAWFFNREKLRTFFAEDFNLVVEFEASEGEVMLEQPSGRAEFCGLFFKRK